MLLQSMRITTKGSLIRKNWGKGKTCVLNMSSIMHYLTTIILVLSRDKPHLHIGTIGHDDHGKRY